MFPHLIKYLKNHKSLGSLLIVFSIGGRQVGRYVGRWAGRLCFFGQVMSPHQSDQMSTFFDNFFVIFLKMYLEFVKMYLSKYICPNVFLKMYL